MLEGEYATEAELIAIDEGAVFNGSVDTHLTDAAIAVKRHRLKGGG